jgi:hypothetical protein
MQASNAFNTAPPGTIWSGTAYGKKYYIIKSTAANFKIRENSETGSIVVEGLSNAALNWYNTSGQKKINTANRSEFNIESVNIQTTTSSNDILINNLSGTNSDGDSLSNFGNNLFDKNSETTPGKRLKNPLGNFSSSTYQISLYMLTTDAYDAFVLSGRKRIDALNSATKNISDAGGAFLIAQSGGINNSKSTRAPGFEFDFAIDNLSFKSILSPKSEGTNTTSVDYTFNIIEPYGFSFFSKLREAGDQINEYSKNFNNGNSIENPSKQIFVLGIKFLGYDAKGNIITGKESYEGGTLDPSSDGTGLFENFHDIAITGINFRLDGNESTYNITAKSVSAQASMTAKRGLIFNNVEITASTVSDAIDQIITSMNKQQNDLIQAKSIEFPNIYKIIYIGNANDISNIKNAKIVTPEDLDKFKLPGSGASSSAQSNVGTSINQKPNFNKRTISIQSSTPILQAFNNVVAQSTFLRDALSLVYDTAIDPGKSITTNPNTKRVAKWYNCTAKISNAKWDSKIADWAYTITYIIQPYETPIIDSSYVNPGGIYYGPHKRYEYWLTGKNTEIIKYEQNLENTYYNVAAVSNDSTAAEPISQTSRRPGLNTPQPRLGKLGNGLEAQNGYLTSLYSPDSYVDAKITIVGDPDFLVGDGYSDENQLYNRFYEPESFTINANGGQVFIEIDFKEAIDYQKNGLLSINDSILFFKYPENIAKVVKGVSYMVIDVQNTFQNGVFTQVLNTQVNNFGDATIAADSSSTQANIVVGSSNSNNIVIPSAIGIANGTARFGSDGLVVRPNSADDDGP